jgi:hypothetical protein
MRFAVVTRSVVPPFACPMYGYGTRVDCFDGVSDPLAVTMVLLEEDGRRALIAATDIGSYANDGRTPALMARLAGIVGCPQENVMLNASHTHGGPMLPMPDFAHLPSNTPELITRYADWFEGVVAEATQEAVASLQPGSIWLGEGRTAVPMNRRPDRDGGVPNAPNAGGPVDDRLFVFALRDAREELQAVGIRLSCHPVATGAQHLLTGDYVGAWKAAFADAFGPGVQPFFLQGSGADARPRHVTEGDHWRTMRHAELSAIGRDLFRETLRVLTRPGMRALGPLRLSGRLATVTVPCEPRYTSREDFEKLLGTGQERYAQVCLQRLASGLGIPAAQSFLVQTLWLDEHTALLGLNAEVLCGMGAYLEAALGPAQAIMLGYTNGVVCYVPEAAEMARGGYETQCYVSQPWTGPLESGMEKRFAAALLERP